MIRLHRYFLVAYVFACLLGFEYLTAQNSNSGQIVGSVTDTFNAQIAGVTVKATNLDTGDDRASAGRERLWNTNGLRAGNRRKRDTGLQRELAARWVVWGRCRET